MVDFVIVKSIVHYTHKVYGKGNVVIAYQNEIKTMNNVLYVLGVKKFFLSIAVIANMGHVMMFEKHTCWIIVAIGPRKILVVSHRNLMNALYKLEIVMPPKHEQHVSLFLLV
jgi:hypothetical protein